MLESPSSPAAIFHRKGGEMWGPKGGDPNLEEVGVRWVGVERDRLQPISISANFGMLNFGTTKGGAHCKKWGPEGGGPKGVGTKKKTSREKNFLFQLLVVVRRKVSAQFLLHPGETTHNASQGIFRVGDRSRVVSGSSWSSSQVRTMASAATMGVCIMAILGAMACPCTGPAVISSPTSMASCRQKDPEEVQVAARRNRFPQWRKVSIQLKEARRAAQGRPLAVQVTECQGFIQRSQNRLR